MVGEQDFVHLDCIVQMVFENTECGPSSVAVNVCYWKPVS